MICSQVFPRLSRAARGVLRTEDENETKTKTKRNETETEDRTSREWQASQIFTRVNVIYSQIGNQNKTGMKLKIDQIFTNE
jgi:hypothetical protein